MLGCLLYIFKGCILLGKILHCSYTQYLQEKGSQNIWPWIGSLQLPLREQYLLTDNLLHLIHTYINYMEKRLIKLTVLKSSLCIMKLGHLWSTSLDPQYTSHNE